MPREQPHDRQKRGRQGEGGGHSDGAYLGSVRDLQTLRGRCVIDAQSGCWHLRSARGRLLPRQARTHVVWVYGRGKVPATRAAWVLAGNEMPGPNLRVGRTCDGYDCVNPQHLRVFTVGDLVRHHAAAGRLRSAAKTAACRATMAARSVVTPELRQWAIESRQTHGDVAHALGVTGSRIGAIRSAFRKRCNTSAPRSVWEWRP